MANVYRDSYQYKLNDGRILETVKNTNGAWIVRVDGVTVPDIYAESHIRAISLAQEKIEFESKRRIEL